MPSPSKAPKFGELSASSMNARNGEMPPPSHDAVAERKRKTLAERAGEPFRKPPAPDINRQPNSGINASSLVSAYRQPSLSSSVASSRPSSAASSRNISNGSYTSTMSTGSRPPSRQAHRPQSALAGSRIQRPPSVSGRPLNSTDAHGLGLATGRCQGKPSGRTPFSSNLVDCPETLESTERHTSYDTQPDSCSDWASSKSPNKCQRAVSISTALNGLSLHESRDERISRTSQKREASLTAALGNMSLITKEPGKLPPPSNPTTPSQIPKRKPSVVSLTSISSPTKSPSKTPVANPRFLNRHTNVQFNEVFDPDDRLSNIESIISEFKNTLDGATTESDGLKEMIAVYKARGLPQPPKHSGFH